MTARYNRQSSLQRYFGAAMEQVNAFLAFMDEITPDGLRAFWGRPQNKFAQRTVFSSTFMNHSNGWVNMWMKNPWALYDQSRLGSTPSSLKQLKLCDEARRPALIQSAA
ncbi:hypothetical protein LTS15_006121 [Exophiala xenobiotica]|nr:hypothetical protein LTS15_006121 [Exophiala xenobiotica]